jgi:glutaredoxin
MNDGVSVTVFATENCQACKSLALQLNKLGISYSYVVPGSPHYERLLQKYRFSPVSAPVTVVDVEGSLTVVNGLDAEKIADEVYAYSYA